MSATVETLLEHKGRQVLVVGRRITARAALAAMVSAKVGSALVLDEGQLVGIFTERDYLRRVVLGGRGGMVTRVEEVMTTDMATVSPRTTLRDCMAKMTRHRCRHLPVLDRGALAGLVSIGDCVAYLCDSLQEENATLYAYIHGHVVA